MALGPYRLPGLRHLRVACLVVLCASGSCASLSEAQDKVARVGVLAFRGTAAAEARWQPLIAYLQEVVPAWRFELVPVTLVTAPERLEANELDFIVTNPGHYVTLAERFRLSALATRERRDLGQGDGLLNYGTVIFTRADRDDIHTLADLSGRTLAAVSPEAFGGFQMAWFEFRSQGLDPFKALKAIRYTGFPQDQIVMDVLAGAADAGVVRSGLLETLAHEGRIEMGRVKVLLSNAQISYPFLVSSRLYPEWPFAAHPGTDRRLAEAVTRALLETTRDKAIAERFALRDLWSAPLSYEGVRAVIAAYRNRDVKADGGGAARVRFSPFWLLATVVSGLGGMALGFLGWRFAAARGPAPVEGGESEQAADISIDQKARFDALTRREREVLGLICRGQPTKRIAEVLHISPKTVEYHRANLLHKTEAGSTPRMVQIATRLGFDQAPNLGETP